MPDNLWYCYDLTGSMHFGDEILAASAGDAAEDFAQRLHADRAGSNIEIMIGVFDAADFNSVNMGDDDREFDDLAHDEFAFHA